MGKKSRRIGFHEDYERAQTVKGPSDKSFGRTFFVVFSLFITEDFLDMIFKKY